MPRTELTRTLSLLIRENNRRRPYQSYQTQTSYSCPMSVLLCAQNDGFCDVGTRTIVLKGGTDLKREADNEPGWPINHGGKGEKGKKIINHLQVLLGIEPRSPESKSDVLTFESSVVLRYAGVIYQPLHHKTQFQ
jgi:hypothetical protein